MNPIAMEAIQMTHESLPTVAATPPMPNSTSGGTPLATQKAPVQSMPRSSPADFAVPPAAAPSAAALMSIPREANQKQRRSSSAISKISPTTPYSATPNID